MTDTKVRDAAPTQQEFLDDVVRGLEQPNKSLPCKYFYDDRGAQLFEQICELDEYYLTRTELDIMRSHAGAMAERLGPNCVLFEYGCGSALKTELLLERLDNPTGYLPIDVSQTNLQLTVERLAERFPALRTEPVCADFSREFELPHLSRPHARKVCYFPGSTIGNFVEQSAIELLRQIARQCAAGGGLLIGIDLKKDRSIIEAAYNDQKGVTRDFNLNLLARINRELDGNFRLDQFEHRAVYNESDGRIEMFLVSQCRQFVSVAGHEYEFAQGERIKTEDSCKYDIEQFRSMANAAGFNVGQVWTDERKLFSVQYLARP